MQKILAFEKVLNEINSADNLLSDSPKTMKVDFVGDIDKYEEGRFDIYVSQDTAINSALSVDKIEIPFNQVADKYGKDFALDLACKNIYDVNYDNLDVYVKYSAGSADGREISLRNFFKCIENKINPHTIVEKFEEALVV